MAQWLKVCIAFSEDLSSTPRTHIRQLTASCNSSTEDVASLAARPLLICGMRTHMWYAYTHMAYAHTHGMYTHTLYAHT